ncbi:putative phage tail protein [alpha proteobacterium U9-1i]|nr:putative phage tail protein [alpha proteobacterium U9-1i]
MSRDDDDRQRGEPIDVDFEPADRGYGRPSGGIGGGTALLLAVFAAGAGAAGGAVAPRVPAVRAALDSAMPQQASIADPANAEVAAALDARIDSLEGIVNTPLGETASTGGGPADTAARVFALQASLRGVEGRLAQMPSSEQTAALTAEVRRLQEELPAVAAEARAAATAARASYAVVAASEAARSSGPFEQAYTSLVALLPNDPNVAALAPLARTGAPTRAELRDRFDRIDNEIVRAARQAQAGAGFWGRIQAALAQWIVVRRAGEGDTPAGVVERASQRLAADDLAGAVQEVNSLSGAPKQVAQRWLTDAQRRLEIDQRITAIRTELSRSS